MIANQTLLLNSNPLHTRVNYLTINRKLYRPLFHTGHLLLSMRMARPIIGVDRPGWCRWNETRRGRLWICSWFLSTHLIFILVLVSFYITLLYWNLTSWLVISSNMVQCIFILIIQTLRILFDTCKIFFHEIKANFNSTILTFISLFAYVRGFAPMYIGYRSNNFSGENITLAYNFYS